VGVGGAVLREVRCIPRHLSSIPLSPVSPATALYGSLAVRRPRSSARGAKMHQRPDRVGNVWSFAFVMVLTPLVLLGCGKSGETSARTQDAAQAAQGSSDQCNRDAQEWFKHSYGTGQEITPGGTASVEFTSHFSRHSFSCYALVKATTNAKQSGTGRSVESDLRRLYDVRKNQPLGRFVEFVGSDQPIVCEIGTAKCLTEAAWNKLVARYMSD
jgi:hypothetical protein